MQKIMSRSVAILPLLFLFIFIQGQASAAVITLANETACITSEGCNFEDPTIWSTNTVPGNEDEVHIKRLDNASVVNVFIRAPLVVTLLDLHVEEVNLHIEAGSTLFTNRTTVTHAHLNVSGNVTTSSYFGSYGSNVTVEGVLWVGDDVWFDHDSLLTIVGTFISHDPDATFAGVIEALHTQSYVEFHHLYLERTESFFLCEPVIYDLSIAPTLNYTFVEGLTAFVVTIPAATTLNVHKHIHVNNIVHFESTNSILNVVEVGPDYSPHLGNFGNSTINWFLSEDITGVLNIYSSVIALVGLDAELDTTIMIHGQNTIYFTALIFDKPDTLVFVPPVGNETVHTRVIVAHSLHLNTPVHIIGDVEVYDSLIISKDVSVTGSVTLYAGHLNVTNASLTAATVLIGYTHATTQLILTHDALVHAPVWILEHGSLITSPIGYIHDDVYNNGTILVSPENRLLISGNYHQSENGRLRVTLTEQDGHPGVSVNGSVQAENGKIEVTSRTKKTLQYDALYATEGINGTFAHPVLLDNSEEGELAVTFKNDVVTISYTHHTDDNDEGFWHTAWPYVIFGVLGGLILIAIIVVFVRRSRKGYQTVKD